MVETAFGSRGRCRFAGPEEKEVAGEYFSLEGDFRVRQGPNGSAEIEYHALGENGELHLGGYHSVIVAGRALKFARKIVSPIGEPPVNGAIVGFIPDGENQFYVVTLH